MNAISTREFRVIIMYRQVIESCILIAHMEKPNPIRQKSYVFAVAIVFFYKDILIKREKEFVLSKQILRSGTSIGANVEEAVSAPTKKDFAHKMSIALKEARETKYWLFLLRDTQYVTESEVAHLLNQLKEIIALLVSILKTSYGSL